MSPQAGVAGAKHNSVYDPAQGTWVLGGQATQPLSAVVPEHEAEYDALMATGIIGAQRFDDFFRGYKRDLIENYGPVARQEVREAAEVDPVSDIITRRSRSGGSVCESPSRRSLPRPGFAPTSISRYDLPPGPLSGTLGGKEGDADE